MGVKGRFPFRIGTTSYILPAGILANVEYLAGKVDDIELVLFESDKTAELPEKGTIEVLRSIAERDNLTYTVHFPLDLRLGDGDRIERKRSVGRCVRIIDRMVLLNPFAYIVHCNRNDGDARSNEAVALWRKNLEASFKELYAAGCAPEKLCVENIDRTFPLLESFIKEQTLSICLDIGHLLVQNLPVTHYLQKYLAQTRAIHLHGVIGGRDHCAVSACNDAQRALLFSALASDPPRERVVTLEVFNESDLDKSLAVMEGFIS